MHLNAPQFALISGKQHFLEGDRGACRASISLYVPLAASYRFSLGLIPNSLTREEGSVNPNIKHPCQMVPPGLPDTPYLSKIPFFSELQLHNFKSDH